jgi:hypothetical protein
MGLRAEVTHIALSIRPVAATQTGGPAFRAARGQVQHPNPRTGS